MAYLFPVVNNPSANAGDARNAGSIPGWGRSPGIGNGNPLQYPCWKIPWTEQSGGLQSMGSQRVEYDLEIEQQQKHGEQKEYDIEKINCKIRDINPTILIPLNVI